MGYAIKGNDVDLNSLKYVVTVKDICEGAC